MSLTTTVKDLAKKMPPVAAVVRGYRGSVVQEVVNNRRNMLRFHVDRIQRARKYRPSRFRFQNHAAIVQQLRRDGFIVLKQVMDKEILLKVKAELEQLLDSGSHVLATKDSARTPGDLNPATVNLTADELKHGQHYFRRHTNFAWIADPLLNCPSVVRIAFDDMLADIATEYLGCPAAIGTLNLRKSYVNDLSDFDTLYFHSDRNSPRFLKFFFYLNDVDQEGGPFCYVTQSHRERFKGWLSKYRWLHEEIASQYGSSRILNLTAAVGDMIVADTTGFHRGTKVRSRDRSMLTINYVIHPEARGTTARFKVSRADFNRLSPKQKAAADFLELVNA